jgi:hypothetical protein
MKPRIYHSELGWVAHTSRHYLCPSWLAATDHVWRYYYGLESQKFRRSNANCDGE